jgi:hypothetical protein
MYGTVDTLGGSMAACFLDCRLYLCYGSTMTTLGCSQETIQTALQVEQPSSSRLIDMPYLRLLIDSAYAQGNVMFRRLFLGIP